MKKIIKNRVYDTDTAKLIGTDSNDLGPRDFHYWEEFLYIKKTGEYFLYGEGGGLSPYAERMADGWTSGEKIVPMSDEQARAWAEEHLEADEYLKYFEVDEDPSLYHYTFALDRRDKEIIDDLRKEKDWSIAETFHQLVQYYNDNKNQ